MCAAYSLTEASQSPKLDVFSDVWAVSRCLSAYQITVTLVLNDVDSLSNPCKRFSRSVINCPRRSADAQLFDVFDEYVLTI